MTPSGISLRTDARDLDALRALLVSLLAQGQQDDALDLVIELLSQLRDNHDALQVRLQTALRQLYGRRSEKSSPEQLALFEKLRGEVPAAATTDTGAAEQPLGGSAWIAL
ncbi:MAG: hypothetical protein WCK28_12020 [Burkholderiales bacterium]